MASDEEDEDSRPPPPKRQRLSQVNHNHRQHQYQTSFQPKIASDERPPLGPVTNGSAKPSELGHISTTQNIINEVPKFDSAEDVNDFFKGLLPREPYNFTKSMRVDFGEIDFLSILGGHDSRFPAAQLPLEMKCRSQVAIYYASNDDDPSQEVKGSDYVETCRKAKNCTFHVMRDEDGKILRKIVLSEPFVFMPEDFYINRRRRVNDQSQSKGDFQHTFGFADYYRLQVFIEPCGAAHSLWPLLRIPPYADNQSGVISESLHEGKIKKDALQIFASTFHMLKPWRLGKIPVWIQHSKKGDKQRIQYGLGLQISWSKPTSVATSSTPIEFAADTSPIKRLKEDPRAASPLTHIREGESPGKSPGDDRIQRRRMNILPPPTYNLKALSAQAQGKSPRKSRECRTRSELGDGETSVTYAFNKSHAGDFNVRAQTTVAGLDCPFCICRHDSLDLLRLHLRTDHSSFKFQLRRGLPRVQFYVDMAARLSENYSNRPRTFQLGRPMGLFDLEKFLCGNDSWVNRRHGPHHEHWPDHLNNHIHDSSISTSPFESRHSSPNTSNGTDAMDFDQDHKFAKKKRVHVVPVTPKLLYDTITKQPLKPGDIVSDSEDERDEAWLVHRKRDLIEDFSDLSDEEKEYANQWNVFLLGEHLTTDEFLPAAAEKFVRENKEWFVERGKDHRGKLFIDHMCTLKLHGAVNNACIHKCFMILQVARREQASEEIEKNNGGDVDMGGMGQSSEKETVKRRSKPRGAIDCGICGEVSKVNRLFCMGPVSQGFSQVLRFTMLTKV